LSLSRYLPLATLPDLFLKKLSTGLACTTFRD